MVSRVVIAVVDCGMVTKQQPSGLLSKMARYFREPESNPNDHDSVQSRTGELEQNALQSLIERKRQDDLVRRREFNHLRKLRTHSWGSSTPGLAGGERPSAFQHSSGFNADDRASTIKKIDAIEATMVEGWSRNKAANKKPLTQRTVPPAQPAQPAPKVAGPAPGVRPPKLTERATPSQQQPLDDLDLDFTAMLSATVPAPLAPAAAALQAPGKAPSKASGKAADKDAAPELAPLEWTEPSKPAPLAPQPAPRNLTPTPALVEQVLLAEPVENGLQAAAMLFAEGDSAAAEAVLLALIQGKDIGTNEADVLASALFDLYRATGQQDGFDVVAMDYAGRFGRSPAEWFSLPEILEHSAHANAHAAPSKPMQVQSQDGVWICPSVLDEAALGALKARFPGANAKWHVTWENLTHIEPQAAPALSELLDYWSKNPVELHWSGVSALLRALEQHSPPDDNTADPLWWNLRLDLLCILGEHEDFESLALDYCVVYEVSPPSWKDLPCECMEEVSASAFAALAEDPTSVLPHESPDYSSVYANCELSGKLMGDCAEMLDRLQAASDSAPNVVVSCAHLIRIDFTATGGILNWASACEAAGCHVEFVNVPRLIAVFFKMLGLDGHAKITVRAN